MATIITTEKDFKVTEKMNVKAALDYFNKKTDNLIGPALIWLGIGCALVLGCMAGDAFFVIGVVMVVVGIVQNIMWKKNPNNRFRNPKEYEDAVLDFVERYKNTPEGRVDYTVNPGENAVPAELFGFAPLDRELGYGYNQGRYYSRLGVYTRFVVCDDRLMVFQDSFISDFVNDRGIHRDTFEIPYSEIAGLAVTSYTAKTYDCSLDAVVVNVLRIQSQQGGFLDCPFSPKDDVDTLVKLVTDLIRG